MRRQFGAAVGSIEDQHGFLCDLAIAGHTLELPVRNRHVDGIGDGFAVFDIDERVVDIDAVIVETGDDYPVREALAIDTVGTDQHQRNTAGFEFLP